MRVATILSWMAIAVLLAVGAVVAVRLWVAYPARVTSGSMSPALVRGDWIGVRKLGGHDRETIRRSQVVVFRFPFGSSGRAVKRVVAVAGDTVEIAKRYVEINGRRIETAGGPDVALAPDGKLKPLPVRERVPAGHVFLLGDNGPASIDSRSFGPAPDTELVGRVWFVIGQPAWWLLATVALGVLAAALALAVLLRRGSLRLRR